MARPGPWSLLGYPDKATQRPRTTWDLLMEQSAGMPVSVDEMDNNASPDNRALQDVQESLRQNGVQLPGGRARAVPVDAGQALDMSGARKALAQNPDYVSGDLSVNAMRKRLLDMRGALGPKDPRVKEQLSKTIKQDEGLQTGLVMTPGQFNQGLNNITSSDAYKRMEKGLADEENMLQMQGAPPSQLDLSPLIALVDSQTGSKLLDSYTKPPTQSEQRKILRDYMTKVQDDRRDLFKGAMSALGNQKFGMYNVKTSDVDQSQVGTQAPKPTGPSAAQARGAMRDRRAFFNDYSKYTKDHRDAMASARGALATVDAGGAVGQQAFRNMMARASGEKGPLSEGDIQRFSGDPSVVSGMQRVYGKYVNGEPFTKEDQADMAALAHAYVNFHGAILQDAASLWANQLSQDYGLSPDEAWNRIQGKVSTGDVQTRPGKAAPAAPGAKKSFAEQLIEAAKASRGK